jgi:hypothetical protein
LTIICLNGVLLVTQNLLVDNRVLGTDPVNVMVTERFVLMPAVDVVPTSNKLTKDAVLLETLTVSQLVKNVPVIFCNSKVHYSVKTARQWSLSSTRSIHFTAPYYL